MKKVLPATSGLKRLLNRVSGVEEKQAGRLKEAKAPPADSWKVGGKTSSKEAFAKTIDEIDGLIGLNERGARRKQHLSNLAQQLTGQAAPKPSGFPVYSPEGLEGLRRTLSFSNQQVETVSGFLQSHAALSQGLDDASAMIDAELAKLPAPNLAQKSLALVHMGKRGQLEGRKTALEQARGDLKAIVSGVGLRELVSQWLERNSHQLERDLRTMTVDGSSSTFPYLAEAKQNPRAGIGNWGWISGLREEQRGAAATFSDVRTRLGDLKRLQAALATYGSALEPAHQPEPLPAALLERAEEISARADELEAFIAQVEAGPIGQYGRDLLKPGTEANHELKQWVSQSPQVPPAGAARVQAEAVEGFLGIERRSS
jgi:hypothetical protein